MAWAILKGMNFPSVVTSVEIDAGARQVVRKINCTVDGLTVDATGKIEFKQCDNALPFFPEEAKNILPWASVLDELNDYRLKVTGLKVGQYEVRLNGRKMAGYSAAALGAGVNLASAVLAEGPIADQVKAVWAAVKVKNDYYHGKIFRGIILAEVKIPDFLDIKVEDLEGKRAAALKERMGRMAGLFAEIRKTLVMQPHRVEIVPVLKQ